MQPYFLSAESGRTCNEIDCCFDNEAPSLDIYMPAAEDLNVWHMAE